MKHMLIKAQDVQVNDIISVTTTQGNRDLHRNEVVVGVELATSGPHTVTIHTAFGGWLWDSNNKKGVREYEASTVYSREELLYVYRKGEGPHEADSE